jgi:T5SS/PEP-CTERM-associated repeat protein
MAGWSAGTPATGANINTNTISTDDLPAADLNDFDLTNGGQVTVTGSVLTVATLVGDATSKLIADADAPVTVTVTTIAGSGGTYEALGVGGLFQDLSTTGNGEVFVAENGGTVELSGPPASTSTLGYVGSPGTMALFNPGSTNAAHLEGLGNGDVIQVPGTSISGFTFAAGSPGQGDDLTIATNAGTFEFPNAAPDYPVNDFTAAPDSATGLEAITFAGNNPARTLSWMGGVSTDFITAANWNDTTDNLTPAIVAPGNFDTVLFATGGGAITGGDTVASLDFGGGGVWQLGSSAAITATAGMIVGDSQDAALEIDAGASVSDGGAAAIASDPSDADSSVSLVGPGSDWQVAGLLDVGSVGSGMLEINDGASVSAGSLDAANAASAVSEIGLTGAGSSLTISGGATVADDGTGVLSVLSGATFTAASLTIGARGDSSGAAVVSGTDSALDITGALNVGTANGTGDLTVGPGAAVHASVVNLQGQVVLEGGLLDPTVQLINQGQTAAGFGTIAAGDIIDEGAIQAGGNKGSQELLIVQGTVLGGRTLTVHGTLPGSVPAGIMQIDAGGTLELSGAVLNSGTTTFTDNLTPTGTDTVNNGVIDVNFVDDAGVLLLDDIAGFAGTIATYQAGDSFVITGGILSDLGVSNNDTLTVSDSGSHAGSGGTDQIIFVSPVTAAGFKIINDKTIEAVVQCFVAGTLIETERGPVAVEALFVSDRVITANGEYEPIVWIGRRAVNCAGHPTPETVWPVRVSAGAFGVHVPVRDLYLSPDHAVLVNDVLVPVKLLINGTSIVQTQRPRVQYFHVELARHAVVLAEGMPVESYLDLGDRSNFNGTETIRLFPDFAARLAPDTALAWETRGAAPLVVTGWQLTAARRAVVENAKRRRARQRHGQRLASHRAEGDRGLSGEGPTTVTAVVHQPDLDPPPAEGQTRR